MELHSLPRGHVGDSGAFDYISHGPLQQMELARVSSRDLQQWLPIIFVRHTPAALSAGARVRVHHTPIDRWDGVGIGIGIAR